MRYNFLNTKETVNVMDDLIRLCDQLENCSKRSKCHSNEIVCAKKWVKNYIKEDENKLLKLKAEVKIHEDIGNSTNIYSMLISFCAFILTIMHNAYGEKSNYYIFFSFFALLLLMMLQFVELYYSKTTRARQKWIKCISVVLDEIEI